MSGKFRSHQLNSINIYYNYFSVAQIIDMAISAEYETSPHPVLSVLNDREQSKLVKKYK